MHQDGNVWYGRLTPAMIADADLRMSGQGRLQKKVQSMCIDVERKSAPTR